MATLISAPYPKLQATTQLPDPEFDDARAAQGSVTVHHKMNGGRVVYPDSSTDHELTLTFELSRMKGLELAAFVESYKSARWKVDLFDNTSWNVQLTGEPFEQTAIGPLSDDARAGKEVVSVTLNLIGKRL